VTDPDPFAHDDFGMFFEYLEGTMLPDIADALARLADDDGRGTYLVALALLTGTEALGYWIPGGRSERASRHNFELCFRHLGPTYAELLPVKRGETPDPYKHLRCSFVQALVPAGNVAVFGRTTGTVTTLRGVALVEAHEPGRASYQRYEILCDRYFEDLVVVAARLHIGVMGYPHPTIHRWTPDAARPGLAGLT
jgi:hypothetical protein